MLMAKISPENYYQNPDRFGLMVIVALVVHAVLILGISFGGFDAPEENKVTPRMEVTLVKTQTEKAPDKVDYLAQANQEGGGNVEETVKPETPFSAIAPKQSISLTTPTPPTESVVKEERATRNELLTMDNQDQSMVADIFPVKKKEGDKAKVAQLLSQSHDIASLEVELGTSMRAYAKMPRRKFISAATKEYKYASYMESWRRKVEKIGNLNFPQEAKRRNLAGELILDVAINPDGTIFRVKVARSSGHKLLDDAALRIVHLAAPYAPLTPAILKETDILHITRTWKFLGGDLTTGR